MKGIRQAEAQPLTPEIDFSSTVIQKIMLDEKGRGTTLTPDKDFSSTVLKKLCSMKKADAQH